MKLAMMSDIHANIQALDACLAHAQSQGATHYAFLGDLVGYGANPAAVVQRTHYSTGTCALTSPSSHAFLKTGSGYSIVWS